MPNLSKLARQALLIGSALAIVGALFWLFEGWTSGNYPGGPDPRAMVALCGMGLAGLAFVAWLER